MNINKVYEIIEQNKDDMLNTLSEWIKIPSVKSEPKEGAPMGFEINKMLNKAISDCEKMGFNVRNFDGYACDARVGVLGKDPIAVLAHLDVVPTGDNWEMDPFSGQAINGYMYGRGSQDDKGPAVAALYAIKAIVDSKINLNREIRLILGTDEESGSSCMKYYSQKCDMPNSGFSPDANFPVINIEKGHIMLTAIAKNENKGLKVIEFNTGERLNVISGRSIAKIKGSKDIIAKAEQHSKENKYDLNYSLDGEIITLEVIGVPGHSAFPESARNSIGIMLDLLKKLGAEGQIKLLADLIGEETDGRSLGIKISDNISGDLTLNIGVIKVNEENVEVKLDIRYPILTNSKYLLKIISEALSEGGFKVNVISDSEPHYVSEKSELVKKLLKAYNEEMGSNLKPLAIGGGTYARELNEGVAFGMLFPDEEELAHQANEKCNIDNLIKSTKIFAKALLMLCSDIEK